MAAPRALPRTSSAGDGSPGSSGRRRGRFQWRRLLMSALVAACLVGVGWAFTLHEDTSDEALEAGAVEAVMPPPNAPVVPSQSTVSADLQFGFEAVLVVDGTEIPLDQLDVIEAQGIVSFTPGRGKEFERFPGGGHVVRVIYWPQAGTRKADAREFSWRFNVN